MRRYLALGDSYTIGEGVADTDSWPNQLAQLLREQGVEMGDARMVARTAWTTDELSDAIDAERLKGPFDLVTMLIGVNDQYRSRPVQGFASEYVQLIRRSVKFARNKPFRVLAISIPDWGDTPFGEGRDRPLIAGEIAEYNGRARELATAAGVAWVDVTGISRAMLHDPTLVAADGLHPTGAMYRRWARHILPFAMAALGA